MGDFNQSKSDTALEESSPASSSDSSPDSTNDSVLRMDELRLLLAILEKVADYAPRV